MLARPTKILAALVLALIVLTATVAYARSILLSDYREATGKYSWVFAYVEGKAFLCDDYSGTTGFLYDVDGWGGGIVKAGGSIVVLGPFETFTPEGETAIVITISRYGGETDAVAVAQILAYRGTCAPLSIGDAS